MKMIFLEFFIEFPTNKMTETKENRNNKQMNPNLNWKRALKIKWNKVQKLNKL